MPNGLFYRNSLGRYISNLRGVWLVFLEWFLIIEIRVFHANMTPQNNANSVDPDQTPRHAASDLDLHCWHVKVPFMGR